MCSGSLARREGRLDAKKIFDQRDLFIVENTLQESCIKNPLVLAKGIQSLIVAPLRAQDSIVGILYLNDFKLRTFDPAICEQLEILSSYAALSIDNARLHATTLRLASTDGLTGLFNHRQVKRIIAREVSRALRYKSQISLVVFDVDILKVLTIAMGILAVIASTARWQNYYGMFFVKPSWFFAMVVKSLSRFFLCPGQKMRLLR